MNIKGMLWIVAMVLMAVELVLLIINLVKHRDFKISLILTVLTVFRRKLEPPEEGGGSA